MDLSSSVEYKATGTESATYTSVTTSRSIQLQCQHEKLILLYQQLLFSLNLKAATVVCCTGLVTEMVPHFRHHHQNCYCTNFYLNWTHRSPTCLQLSAASLQRIRVQFFARRVEIRQFHLILVQVLFTEQLFSHFHFEKHCRAASQTQSKNDNSRTTRFYSTLSKRPEVQSLSLPARSSSCSSSSFFFKHSIPPPRKRRFIIEKGLCPPSQPERLTSRSTFVPTTCSPCAQRRRARNRARLATPRNSPPASDRC